MCGKFKTSGVMRYFLLVSYVGISPFRFHGSHYKMVSAQRALRQDADEYKRKCPEVKAQLKICDLNLINITKDKK